MQDELVAGLVAEDAGRIGKRGLCVAKTFAGSRTSLGVKVHTRTDLRGSGRRPRCRTANFGLPPRAVQFAPCVTLLVLAAMRNEGLFLSKMDQLR